MMTEDSNKKLIYTELVKVYIEYESYFQQAFACYFQMNYNKSRIVRPLLPYSFSTGEKSACRRSAFR